MLLPPGVTFFFGCSGGVMIRLDAGRRCRGFSVLHIPHESQKTCREGETRDESDGRLQYLVGSLLSDGGFLMGCCRWYRPSFPGRNVDRDNGMREDPRRGVPGERRNAI